MNALKFGDKRILEQYEDVYPAELRNYLPNQTEEPQMMGKLASSPEVQAMIMEFLKKQSQKEQKINLNQESTHSGPTSPDGKPDGDANNDVAENVLPPKSTKTNRNSHGKSIRSSKEPKGELSKTISASGTENGLSAHDVLQQAQHICPANEYLEA